MSHSELLHAETVCRGRSVIRREAVDWPRPYGREIQTSRIAEAPCRKDLGRKARPNGVSSSIITRLVGPCIWLEADAAEHSKYVW